MAPQEIVDKIDTEMPYEMYGTLNELLDDNKEEEALLYLQNYFKCVDDIAKEALTLYKKTGYAEHKEIIDEARASLTLEQKARNIAAWRDWLNNKPKCPICQSTNLKKISNWSKSASVMVWGVLAAGRVSKTWHYNNCDSEW